MVDRELEIDEASFGLLHPIDLAVNAIEIADLVGIQIHAQRNPLRPPAEHGIHESKVLERALVMGKERLTYKRFGHVL